MGGLAVLVKTSIKPSPLKSSRMLPPSHVSAGIKANSGGDVGNRQGRFETGEGSRGSSIGEELPCQDAHTQRHGGDVREPANTMSSGRFSR